MVRPLKRNIKEALRTGKMKESFFFLFKMRRKRKHKQGNTGAESRFLSAGAPRWIRPGFWEVKWAWQLNLGKLSIKSPYLES